MPFNTESIERWLGEIQGDGNVRSKRNGAAAPAVDQRQVMGAVVASGVSAGHWICSICSCCCMSRQWWGVFSSPSEHAMLSLAAVYASFAVTLLMRPLGSALFGSYADRRGPQRRDDHRGGRRRPVDGRVRLASNRRSSRHARADSLPLLRLIQGVFVGGVVARRTPSVRNPSRRSIAAPCRD